MADRRERDHQWYQSFDAGRMVIVIEGEDGEDINLPARYEVCETCDGKGSHVNPSIDSQGLSREDFDEDPDFAEGYWEGRYDQPCNECHGQRVVPEVDMDKLTEPEKKMVEERIEAHYSHQREVEAERRFGA